RGNLAPRHCPAGVWFGEGDLGGGAARRPVMGKGSPTIDVVSYKAATDVELKLVRHPFGPAFRRSPASTAKTYRTARIIGGFLSTGGFGRGHCKRERSGHDRHKCTRALQFGRWQIWLRLDPLALRARILRLAR